MKPPSITLYNKVMLPLRGLPCERCPTLDSAIHHIIYRSQFQRMALVFLNLIPLCVHCHAEAHRDKLKFFEWLDRKYPKRLEKLNDIRVMVQHFRNSHVEVAMEYGGINE